MMKRWMFLAALLLTSNALAQNPTRWVQIRTLSNLSGTCSSGSVGIASDTGDVLLCVYGSWTYPTSQAFGPNTNTDFGLTYRVGLTPNPRLAWSSAASAFEFDTDNVLNNCGNVQVEGQNVRVPVGVKFEGTVCGDGKYIQLNTVGALGAVRTQSLQDDNGRVALIGSSNTSNAFADNTTYTLAAFTVNRTQPSASQYLPWFSIGGYGTEATWQDSGGNQARTKYARWDNTNLRWASAYDNSSAIVEPVVWKQPYQGGWTLQMAPLAIYHTLDDLTASLKTVLFTRNTSGVPQVGIGTATPATNATLEVSSILRLTPLATSSLPSCVSGLAGGIAMSNTTTNHICFCDGTSWKKIESPGTGC